MKEKHKRIFSGDYQKSWKFQLVLTQLKRGLSTTNTEDKTKKIQAAVILGKRMLRKMKLDLITNPTAILLRLMILSHL